MRFDLTKKIIERIYMAYKLRLVHTSTYINYYTINNYYC